MNMEFRAEVQLGEINLGAKGKKERRRGVGCCLQFE